MDTRKYILGSGLKRARLTRVIAKGIDFIFVIFLSVIAYPFGVVLGAIYLGVSDYLQDGQSIGKKLIGFKVISLKDGKPCTMNQSLVRNLPFLIPLLLCVIPFWGWIIGAVLACIFTLLELYFIFKLESAHRLGDLMADTTIIADDPNRADLKNASDSWFETGKNMSPCNREKC